MRGTYYGVFFGQKVISKKSSKCNAFDSKIDRILFQKIDQIFILSQKIDRFLKLNEKFDRF